MILITGGAGFIGSHACVALSVAGYDYVILDDFSNSQISVLGRLGQIIGGDVKWVKGSVADVKLVAHILRSNNISAVLHFAASKAVGESVAKPLHYYRNNVSGTVALLEAMRQADVGTLVFSSSATVYGDPATVPIQEAFPLSATNPYGRTKLMTEQLLADVVNSDPDFWRVARLRYFNPVGAHESGLIGEDPSGVPNNLIPYVAQVAAGIRPFLNIWGDDYPTADGTGVRDFIHVMDLAEGHVAALRYLETHRDLLTVNLGTGCGTSVLQIVKAFERVTGTAIPCKVGPRRPGDIAYCWADPSLAKELLSWRATRSLDQMCEDAWRWQSRSC